MIKLVPPCLRKKKDKIIQRKVHALRSKKRIDTLVSMEKEDRDKIQKETKEVTKKIIEKMRNIEDVEQPQMSP